MSNSGVHVKSLGQVGFIFEYGSIKWIIDPYLFNYVADLYGPSFNRQYDLEIDKEELENISHILITHEHEDHCDPVTIKFIVDLNENIIIVCPRSCNEILLGSGINSKSIINPRLEDSIELEMMSFKMIPAAHTKLEISDGFTRWAGYLMKIKDKTIYHAGDTIPYDGMHEYIPRKVDLAFLPINERNYYRNKDGIIGNMSCREALQLVTDLEIKEWVPTHWDLFMNNGTYKEELDLLAKKMAKQNYRWIDPGTTYKFKIS